MQVILPVAVVTRQPQRAAQVMLPVALVQAQRYRRFWIPEILIVLWMRIKKKQVILRRALRQRQTHRSLRIAEIHHRSLRMPHILMTAETQALTSWLGTFGIIALEKRQRLRSLRIPHILMQAGTQALTSWLGTFMTTVTTPQWRNFSMKRTSEMKKRMSTAAASPAQRARSPTS